jgi:hypothetical protein
MSFGLYAIGFAILIGGLIYAGYLVHMPGDWIAAGAIVLLGIGILTGVKATRQRDPAGQRYGGIWRFCESCRYFQRSENSLSRGSAHSMDTQMGELHS